jgi:uncharacterized protein (UPF0333 family)
MYVRLFVRHFLLKGSLLSIAFVLGTEMKHLNNNKSKNNSIVTAAMLLSLATILVIAGVTTPLTALASRTGGEGFEDIHVGRSEPKAPMAVSEDGNNVYIVWWTNKSENWEVMFRASNDGGATFGDKINLSNSTDAESQNAEIVAAGENNVFVSWWETNPITGSSDSVLRASTDAGQTFGPVIMLGTNGTVTTTEEEGGEAVEAVEEAVGGAQVAE